MDTHSELNATIAENHLIETTSKQCTLRSHGILINALSIRAPRFFPSHSESHFENDNNFLALQWNYVLSFVHDIEWKAHFGNDSRFFLPRIRTNGLRIENFCRISNFQLRFRKYGKFVEAKKNFDFISKF